MPALYILIILGAIVVWFLIYNLYQPLGRLLTRIFDKSMSAMEIDKDEDESNDK